MSELEKLQQALDALEAQRHMLGDDVVDAALAPMHEKIASLQDQETAANPKLKLVTVLFTDVTGSTQISQQLDPEDMLEVMDGAMKRLGAIVEQHGGRVIKYMGDGFMALFGDSVTREDDAIQAVRAGLEILREALSYGLNIKQTWGLSGFNVRVGINTGQVILGGGVEADNSAMGMTINLAQRMESSAPIGGLRISRATYRHVRDVFNVSAQPPIKVKGKDEPLETYLVLSAKERQFHAARSGIEGVKSEFIGREAELTRLQEFFYGAVAGGQTQIVTVVGDPGVGKSRLLFEFEQWVQSQKEYVTLFTGRADQQREGVPYGLLHNLFTKRCQILESDSAIETRRKFEESLAPLFGTDAQAKTHFIGALLGFEFSDSTHLRGVRDNPVQLREQALFYLIQYFTSLLKQGPALVLLEDIHWADTPSLEFIQKLGRECPQSRLMVLGLARPVLFEQRPARSLGQSIEEANDSRIYLEPLSNQACQKLINENLKKVQNIPPRLRDLIMHNAEGNPFYVEEIINILIDDGVIIRDEANIEWRVETLRLNNVRVPPTLAAVLEARLDRLPSVEKLILQQAAVVGRNFWDAVLKILYEGNVEIGAQLISLCDRELIFPWPTSAFSHANEYLFKHMLFRDVAYDTVLKRDRRKYHELIADWLVETCKKNERTDEYPAVIGEHFALAGHNELAANWFLRAAEKAHSQGAPQEARYLLDRTLKLLAESGRNQRWRALLILDQVLSILGETEARRETGDELLALAQAAGNDEWLSNAYFRQASHAASLGNERSALSLHKLALESIRNTNNRQLEVQILGMMLTSQTRLGDLASAAKTAKEAMDAADELGEDEILGTTRHNVAFFYAEAGEIAKATRILEQQVILFHELDNLSHETASRINLGYNYVHLGLFAQARHVLEKALFISDSIGARRLNSFARYNLGLVHWREGEFDLATSIITSAIQELNHIGDAFGIAAGQSYHALALESSNDLDNALNNYISSHDGFEALGARAFASDALAGILRCQIAQENLVAARIRGEQLWEYLVTRGSEGMEFPAFAYLTCTNAFTLFNEPAIARKSTELGYSMLMTKASKINDPVWRNSFLGNVSERRRLVEKWNLLSAGG